MALLFRSEHHAKVYQKYRPEYPPSVHSAILKYLDHQGTTTPSSAPTRWNTAFDLGCGTGISTLPLCGCFERVVGIDVSEAQIEEARRSGAGHEGLTYRVGLAHDLGFQADGTVDLVTIGLALHYVDTEKFYPECRRILRPGGVLAAYGHGIPRVDNAEAHSVVMHFYDVLLEKYWDPGRRHINDRYDELFKDFSLAFPTSERDDSLVLEKEYSLEDFIGYLQTWSGYQNYIAQNPDAKDPLKDVASRLRAIFSRSCDAKAAGDATTSSEMEKSSRAGSHKDNDDEAMNETRFSTSCPIFILLGRKQ